MFALRGIVVSLSVFAIVYCVSSLFVGVLWRRIYLSAHDQPRHRVADLLFALRMFPFASAAVITAAFTVPSFLLLEPRSIDEPMSGGLVALGFCGMGLGVFGFANTASALVRASRAISAWTAGARSLPAPTSHPVLRISHAIPPMAAVGIVRPKVLISGAAQFILSENEMRAALNHEAAHIQRRDNLKKLLLRSVAFPGMRGLETAWLESTEMAADDAAVSCAAEALDLAAALVKLSRFATPGAGFDLTAAVVTGPISIVNARVERLISWTERAVVPHSSPLWPLAAAGGLIAGFAITYGQLLVRIHAATEWLMR
jgi:Zn-dependent protease with chaperone function